MITSQTVHSGLYMEITFQKFSIASFSFYLYLSSINEQLVDCHISGNFITWDEVFVYLDKYTRVSSVSVYSPAYFA